MMSKQQATKAIRELIEACDSKGKEVQDGQESLKTLSQNVVSAKSHAVVVLNALDTMPEDVARSIPEAQWSYVSNIYVSQKSEIESFSVPAYSDSKFSAFSSGILTATTATTGSIVEAVMQYPKPTSVRWLETVNVAIAELSDEEMRLDNIDTILQKVLSGRKSLLAVVRKQMAVYRLTGDGAAETALAIRSILDQLKGDFLEKARKQPGENTKWQDIASRLSRGGAGSPAESALMQLKTTFDQLYGLLSNIAKSTPPPVHTLETAFQMFLNFLDSFFGLIDQSNL